MLRDYQSEICRRVQEAWADHRSVMLQMPTGTGKTVVLAELVKGLGRTGNYPGHEFGHKLGHEPGNEVGQEPVSILIVAHRIELIAQISAFLRRFGIDHGEIAGGKRPRQPKPVMVASIQTLAKSQPAVLRPSLVIIDEAHHALAQSYRMLWTAWPEARFLGLTATPCRLSGEGFTSLFDVLVTSWSIKRFIASGWLAPYDYYSIRPDSDEQRVLDSLKKRGTDGDFQLTELREKLDVRPSIEKLYETFARFVPKKKGIVYAIDIAHADHIAACYRQRGVEAVALSSRTPARQREEIIRSFRNTAAGGPPSGAIQVLVNVDLFSEGFDCPDVEFVQLARPTLSLAKYLQMVGRGLRPCQGKACCTILDNVGLYRRFGLPSADRDWEMSFLGRETFGDLKEAPQGNEQFLWLGRGDLLDESDTDIVKIVSHEAMQLRFGIQRATGFERRRKGTSWVWTDMASGVEFGRHPRVVNYRDLELSTADGETFFPRVRSRWIDARHGINRKALETQVGEGVGWMRLYISFASPHRVLQLQCVKPNQVRIYHDEHGMVFLQQDLDHAPVSEAEAGGQQRFMAHCDEARKVWLETVQGVRSRFIQPDFVRGVWMLPEQATVEHDGKFCHIRYTDHGEPKEMWADWDTGFIFLHRPVVKRRGFVELCCDGEEVYIQNIRSERFMPYHNWEIRADDRICTIGNKLYFSEIKEEGAYLIKKRSDDFRMFVVEESYPDTPAGSKAYGEFMIINKAGQQLEIARASG